MTTVQKLLDQISDPNARAAYSQDCLSAAKNAATKAMTIAPYAVTQTEALTLERIGITTSPFATTSHTHAADKIIENDCLEIIGRYLPKEPVTLIQLKRAKLHLLKRGPNTDIFQNYCHEPKDVLRFGLTNPHVCPVVNTSCAVISDTLHFMSSQQVWTLFKRNPQLQRLYGTLVLPVEALNKLPSLFPEVYKLEYYDNHFAYMPGGHGGGAYIHSYGTLKWLSTAQIGTESNHLSIEKIETKGAHHIMLIQRRRPELSWPLPPLWVFHASDYVKLPEIFYPSEANVQRAYPHTFIKRLQLYCFSVKAVSLRDIFAKIRQVIPTEELSRFSTADLIRLANYLLFITGMQQTSDYQSPLMESLLGKLCLSIRARVREFFQNLMGKSSYAALLTVTDVRPVYFTTKPIRRPICGQPWFDEAEMESKPETPTITGYPNPSPDDLDLLAEFERHERAIMEENCSTSKTNVTSNPAQNTQQRSEYVTPEKLSHSNDEFHTQVTSSQRVNDHTRITEQSRPTNTCEKLTDDANMMDGHITDWTDSDSDQSDADSEIHPETNLSQTIHDDLLPDENDLPELESIADEQSDAEDNEDPTIDQADHCNTTCDAETDKSVKTPVDVESSPKITSRVDLTPLDSDTVEILRLHGFTNYKPQHDGDFQIAPVFYNHQACQLPLYDGITNSVQSKFIEMAHALKRNCYNYTLDAKRATAFMSDVKNNLTGLVLPKLDRDLLTSWVALSEHACRKVGLIVIHGAGGAGKSRALQEILRSNSIDTNEVNIIVPTINLAVDWKKKMPKIDPRRVMTFEKACEREGKSVVIMDDYGKLPAGYIDAYLAIKFNVEIVILTGDQRQSVFHNDRKDSQIALLTSNTAHFKRYCDYYLNATHRQPRRLANPIRVHAERETGGAIKHSTLIPTHAMTLVPAFRSQSLLTDLGRQAMTYAGCQGLTLPHLTIVLDKDTPLCSDEVLYTALSRASETITFVNTYSNNKDFLDKLDSTPYLKTLISGVREDEQAGVEIPPPEPEVRNAPTKTHIPVANNNVQLESKIETMEDKDTRELWSGEEKTNLMQTQDPVIQLFPHQQAKDEALFKITINERIKLANPETNRKALKETLNTGNLLFEAYANFMNVPRETQPFDKRLWAHCRQLALRTYLSKPTSNLQQGAQRQDPDFPENAIALFNKSQWVKKLEKVGCKFKAGQTISAFKQSTVLLTTTMALYLRKKRESHQPDNVFVMCEKTPEQFNSFVLTKWDFTRPNYTSDYTQYDQSQDSAFLNFELRKAKHFGLPDEVVDFYAFIKTHAKTFLGNLAVMRLSGEGPTFDANTECNIAYDALRFQLDSTVNACYAGDDLVRDKACDERPGWKYAEPLFSLKAKPLVTSKPDFCGWRLTKYGIVKSPVQLYQSLQLALRLGKVEEVKRSYAIDYLFAYRLGDQLYDIFDEDELAKHQLVTRTLIKKGMQPPSSGEHLPTFHVTSDRLIRDPKAIQVLSYESDRIIVPTNIVEDHFTSTSRTDRDDMTAESNRRASGLCTPINPGDSTGTLLTDLFPDIATL
uniref:Replicase n=1 Tax=Garlic virus X TaxID=150284 RepID=A0A6M2YYF3_9VIRU|nr:replicase [Garlic virus X]QED45021.1 replicase [Garlic virus X]QED45033.1 replicase [Garlic virus X]